jgi:hypothetical protein
MSIYSPLSVRRAARSDRSRSGMSNKASSSCTRFETADWVVCSYYTDERIRDVRERLIERLAADPGVV